MTEMNMEQLVAQLRNVTSFKKEIDTGDLVLIAADEPRMVAYAVITGIEADATRRDPWWHVHMQMLAVPLQPMTWTLRMEQMCGREIFTMGGKKMFMAPLAIDYDQAARSIGKPAAPHEKRGGKPGLRVIK